MPTFGGIITIFGCLGVIGSFAEGSQHDLLVVSAQQTFIKMKWYDSAYYFFQVDRHFPNFFLYILKIFPWFPFIYFGGIFQLLSILLNLKLLLDLIYTMFSGCWVLHKIQPGIILGTIFCQNHFDYLKPWFIFVHDIDIIIDVCLGFVHFTLII